MFNFIKSVPSLAIGACGTRVKDELGVEEMYFVGILV